MYTIQYANGVRIWEVAKYKLHYILAHSEHDISDVFEQSTPVTKRVRKELAEAFDAGRLKHATPAARRFMSQS